MTIRTHVRSLLVAARLVPLVAAAQDDHGFSFTTIAGNEIAWSCEGAGTPTIALALQRLSSDAD